MSKILRLVSFGLASVLISLPAFAQVEKNQGMGYAGLMLGFADPTNMDPRLGYGANVGLIFPMGLTGSIYILNSTESENGVDTSVLHYGLGVDYSLSGMFSGPLGGLHAGLKLGMATAETEFRGASNSEDFFTFGPSVGYDYPIVSYFSVGGEANLLLASGDNTVSTLYVLATGKFWF